MENRLQERNLNFLKPSGNSILQSFNNTSISLRKQKRLRHQNEVRKIIPNDSLPQTHQPALGLESHKDIIRSSSVPSEVFRSLEHVKKMILKEKNFPFESFFDADLLRVYNAYISQSDDLQIFNSALTTLINAFAANLAVCEAAKETGIVDSLFNLLKLNNDPPVLINVIYALGNIHDFKPEYTSSYQMAGHWMDLLRVSKSSDLDLVAAAIWSLSIYYKKRNNLPKKITREVFSQVFPLFRSRDAAVLIEMLWLMYNMMNNNMEIVELFAERGLLVDLFGYISMANFKFVSPACYIIDCVIVHSEKYSEVLIEMGICSRVSASFESKNTAHKLACINIYAALLGRSQAIAWRIVNEPQFNDFIRQLSGTDKVKYEVLIGVLSLTCHKDLAITGLLLSLDLIKLLIPLLKTSDSNILIKVLAIYTNVFDLYSTNSRDQYETLLQYFLDLQGLHLLESLELSKNFQVQHDSKAFIETFYGSVSGDILRPTSNFMIS